MVPNRHATRHFGINYTLQVPDRSTGQSSILCRCGSGGALLPPPRPPPPFIPPVISGFPREAQSLPSTLNANRRLISLSPRPDRTFRLDVGSERRKQNHSIPKGLIQVPIPPPPPPAPPLHRMEPCYQGYNASFDCSGVGVSESTVLASGMGIDDPHHDGNSTHHHHQQPPPPHQPHQTHQSHLSPQHLPPHPHSSHKHNQHQHTHPNPMPPPPPQTTSSTSHLHHHSPSPSPHHHLHRPGNRVRALNQVWSQQARSLRYRASSQPLMKASSMIIGLIAVVIIGFIVLSPLFHILLP